MRGTSVSRAALASVLAALAAAPAACASELIDRGAGYPALKVDASGHALVTYSARGAVRRVHAWGAINARAPALGIPQVSFRLNYRGRGFPGGTCLRYDGPPLAWLVRACKAPDGSYWALQAWERLKSNFGGASGARELRLSHWAGPLPQLWLKLDWAYRQRFDHLYGALSYAGVGVHGFSSTGSGVPLDGYGRNVYVDTFDSRYGRGWRRENGFLTHAPNGSFCYGFYPHGSRPVGKGSHYRATVIGPGVTPDVMAQGAAPGPYDARRERAANDEQRRLFAGSPPCRAR